MLFVLSLAGAILGGWLWASQRRTHPGSRTTQAALLAAVVFLIAAAAQTFTVIPAGSVGIVDVFGNVSQTTLKSGPQFVNPLARVVKLSTQTQETKIGMEVSSKDSLTLPLEASLQFHIDPEKAFEIYNKEGDDYVAKLVEPQFRAVTSTSTPTFDATALYTSQRAPLAKLIQDRLRGILTPRGILVEDDGVRLQKLTLPPKLAAAIEERKGAELESQRVFEEARQEAERRKIEAQGVADSQRILAQGLTEPLLRLKGIEATLKLAESQNAKVIVVGSCKDGMPVILGGGQ
jgi:regulator of protease activity HflC (stomatin/prohibitin superfamily)